MRQINSPGVTIKETDLSQFATVGGATRVLTMGYAPQGPTDEVLTISTISEFEQVYGVPQTPAERYFYHTSRQVLNSPATLLVSRLPYGPDTGAGFGKSYSALLYPVTSGSNTFNIQAPVHATLSENDYNNIIQGNVNWTTRGYDFISVDQDATDNLGFTLSSVFVPSLSSPTNNGYRNLSAVNDCSVAGLQHYSICVGDITLTGTVSSYYFDNTENQNYSTDAGYLSSGAGWFGADIALKGETFYISSLSANSGTTAYFKGTIPTTDTNTITLTPIKGGDIPGPITQYDSDCGAIENTGLIVLNSSKTTINENYEGYYVTVTDNSGFGPDQDYNAVTAMYSLTSDSGLYGVNSTRLGFALSSSKEVLGVNSVSQVIESAPTYNFNDSFYNDTVIVNVFKIRSSIYEPQILSYSTAETFIGSFNPNKKTVAASGGTQRSFYIQDVVNNSSNNIRVFINPEITRSNNWISTSVNVPNYTVRTADEEQALFPVGTYVPSYSYTESKNVGNVYQKVDRVLSLVSSPETIAIDVVTDGGLSTIFANTSGTASFDDTTYQDISNLRSADDVSIQRCKTIHSLFDTFVSTTRKDCVFVADPLRQIFVNGAVSKTLSDRNNSYTTNIFGPLKNLFGDLNSNYSITYGNWVKVYDQFSDTQVYVPFSGFAAAAYATTDAVANPWIAPAGLTRGIIRGITDIAFNPNQKQRDDFYTISVNPVVFFSGDGYVIFGQKTLQTRPSAFDRINVRRLFLTLERATQSALRYFVFEPNTGFTRTRLINTITPIFETAKNTEGLYDYLIVCDERNNTPDVIDQNTLAVDIYIKPVRAAEYILVNFIATRTGQNFQELL
jgi:hypothetical protein